MSYQVLARKYRPKSFDTLVGQEHVVRALTHALEQQRLHHAYLFTGTRGVGKTTLSRILAKSLNCIGPDGQGTITAHPCGVCEACVAIDAGRFVDYIEMDAASNRGVDEMAQLLEQAVYAPSNARFKVYMIDEVHMLTNHAFNAMLKTLEEPPPHVKFILATTDPQKIPVTVLSRCLQFNLKQMPPGHIISHLANILGKEEIDFEQPALNLLAQGAHGSMRDALSLTDQAIAYAAGKVTLEAVQGMLGTLDQSYLLRVFFALADQDGEAMLAVANEMAERSLSYHAALQDMGALLHQIALAQAVPAALAEDVPHREEIVQLAQRFTPEQSQLFYQIVVHGRKELSLAPDEYAGFSMTLLRMLAFVPVSAGMQSPPVAPGRTTPAASRSTPATAAPTTTAPSAAPSAPAIQIPPAPAAPVAQSVSAAPAAPAEGKISPAKAALAAARAAAGRVRQGGAPAATPALVTDLPPQKSAPQKPVLQEQEPAGIPPWEEAPAAEKKTEFVAAVEEAVTSEPAPLPEATAEVVVQEAVTPEQAEPAPVPVPQTPVSQASSVSSTGWDGDWPALAASLPMKGVARELAQQSEFIRYEDGGHSGCFYLRIPVETLSTVSGTVDKLAAELSARIGKPVRVETEVGAVQETANAKAEQARQARQEEAERMVDADPFVQAFIREFDGMVVPGSVRPL